MDNLETLDNFDKNQLQELQDLMSSEEQETLDYYEWMDAQIMGQTSFTFTKKRINRRKYKKGKKLYTKCRIAGAVLKTVSYTHLTLPTTPYV